MKKAILLSFALLIGISVMAQPKAAKPDTAKKIEFTQQEVGQFQQILQETAKKIHVTHMDALRRDTLDNLLGTLSQFINQRAQEAIKPKEVKKGENH